MATLDAFRPARPAPATGIFSALLGSLIAWNDRRVTVRLLSRLTDHELSDIGLDRSDIASWTGRR